MKYKVHRYDIHMGRDQSNLERFLNQLEGEVVAVIPNITLSFLWAHRVNFLYIIEKISE